MNYLLDVLWTQILDNSPRNELSSLDLEENGLSHQLPMLTHVDDPIAFPSLYLPPSMQALQMEW
jgi:hypothetical protein